MIAAQRYPTGERVEPLIYAELRLIGGEAIEEAVAAGAAQIRLAAATVGATRGMRGIPRPRRLVVTQTLAVDMPHYCGALRAARPIMAGFVFAGRKGAAVGLRAGQRVVLVGGVAAPVDNVTFLGQRGLFGQIVVAVQLVEVFGNHHPFGVLPWPLPDAVAGIDRRLAVCALRAEVRWPEALAGSNCLCELLAKPIGARQTAEVGTFAGAGAGHEETQLRLLGLHAAAQQIQRSQKKKHGRSVHIIPHIDDRTAMAEPPIGFIA